MTDSVIPNSEKRKKSLKNFKCYAIFFQFGAKKRSKRPRFSRAKRLPNSHDFWMFPPQATIGNNYRLKRPTGGNPWV